MERNAIALYIEIGPVGYFLYGLSAKEGKSKRIPYMKIYFHANITLLIKGYLLVWLFNQKERLDNLKKSPEYVDERQFRLVNVLINKSLNSSVNTQMEI